MMMKLHIQILILEELIITILANLFSSDSIVAMVRLILENLSYEEKLN